jgi:hypothetical protein
VSRWTLVVVLVSIAITCVADDGGKPVYSDLVARCPAVFQNADSCSPVFKVEQFYCVMRVKDMKRLSPGQPYMNQMDVAVQFTNTKP